MKKYLTKASAVILSAVMTVTPVTAFAEEVKTTEAPNWILEDARAGKNIHAALQVADANQEYASMTFDLQNGKQLDAHLKLDGALNGEKVLGFEGQIDEMANALLFRSNFLGDDIYALEGKILSGAALLFVNWLAETTGDLEVPGKLLETELETEAETETEETEQTNTLFGFNLDPVTDAVFDVYNKVNIFDKKEEEIHPADQIEDTVTPVISGEAGTFLQEQVLNKLDSDEVPSAVVDKEYDLNLDHKLLCKISDVMLHLVLKPFGEEVSDYAAELTESWLKNVENVHLAAGLDENENLISGDLMLDLKDKAFHITISSTKTDEKEYRLLCVSGKDKENGETVRFLTNLHSVQEDQVIEYLAVRPDAQNAIALAVEMDETPVSSTEKEYLAAGYLVTESGENTAYYGIDLTGSQKKVDENAVVEYQISIHDTEEKNMPITISVQIESGKPSLLFANAGDVVSVNEIVKNAAGEIVNGVMDTVNQIAEGIKDISFMN